MNPLIKKVLRFFRIEPKNKFRFDIATLRSIARYKKADKAMTAAIDDYKNYTQSLKSKG